VPRWRDRTGCTSQRQHRSASSFATSPARRRNSTPPCGKPQPGVWKAGSLRIASRTIDVAPGAERRIALVRLPTLIVTYRFTAGSRAAREALLTRLDRAMHRGGG
jgi:hypothetical protein